MEDEPNRIKCSFERWLIGHSIQRLWMRTYVTWTTACDDTNACDGERCRRIKVPHFEAIRFKWILLGVANVCGGMLQCSHSICITCEAVSAWLFRCVAICGVYRITFIKVLILIFASYSVSICVCVCRHTRESNAAKCMPRETAAANDYK